MPEEYLRCKESYMKKGVSEKTASARCAAMYYKRHGVTVREAAKKEGEGANVDYDEELYKAILATESDEKKQCTCGATATERNGVYIKMNAVAINTEMIADGIVEIIATMVGANAFTSDGVKIKWTKKTLEAMSHTWTNGTVSINHDLGHIHGKILASWFDGKGARQVLKVDDYLAKWIAAGAPLGIGVSIEADEIVYNDKFDILEARGTGVTIVFPPATPACPPEDGCAILGTEEQVSDVVFDTSGSADKYDLVTVIVADEKSASAEEADANSGETMADEDKEKIVAAELEKKAAELEATKKELEELRAFKEQAVIEEKKTALVAIATYIDSKPFENEHLCTMKAVASALEAYKKKMDEAPEVNSGATATEREDKHQDTEPTFEGASPEEAKEFMETAKEFEKKTGRKVY